MGAPSCTVITMGYRTSSSIILPSALSYLAPNKPIFLDSVNPRAKIPYSMEYNFGIDRQLTPNTSLSVQYVGNVSRHQWGQYGYNSPYSPKIGDRMPSRMANLSPS